MPETNLMPTELTEITPEIIHKRVFVVRDQSVMLDSDLAALYGVPTQSLNLAVGRNKERFPAHFMLQLSEDEASALRFQFETSYDGRGWRRYLPYVFTERGVAMLSSVLRSERAVQVNVPTNARSSPYAGG